MVATALLSRLESRAVAKGLAIFLIVTVFVPIIVTVAASLGPREWLAEYVYPARRFEPVLFISAGALAALVISRSPILNSLVAAVIGAVISLTLAVMLRASPHLDAAGFALEYLVVPIAWCLVGVICVALARRGRNAL
jgi:ABC-type glycerol-3-phosphate transport system permease component